MEIRNVSVPKEVSDLLKDQRFGISFPCSSGCQMRFVHRGEDKGGFYSYRQWGGIRNAVEAAISRNLQLRVMYKRRGRTGKPAFREGGQVCSNTGVIGVYGSRYFDQRREKHYFRYMVRWADPKGESKMKTFNLTEPYTPDQKLHTLRTATAFRKLWEMELDQFKPARFNLWRQKRLYEPGQPDLPPGFWGITDMDKAG
ncbi:hypothetical protein PSH49_20815 [Pseudoalteromonas sp. GABNS16G]|uniref:hypothetical protein n=1 Tax=Pseudoalteromonas sp. GABNS16G TaxID=3025324 RepID=UPI002359364D|nr:hypothetical protein [Pseudoalteromonas sp. GABNS16G]MDC9603033.1 hypothetical protein [Pseudoalteromonas sp. GABNS16G]